MPNQARRRVYVTVALIIVLFGAFILLRPRLWVKNKTAKVIVDGRLSEDVKLFHGSDGRLLFYLHNDLREPFLYDQGRLAICNSNNFLPLKIIALTIHNDGTCADGEKAELGNIRLGPQALQFVHLAHNVTVSWQAAPR